MTNIAFRLPRTIILYEETEPGRLDLKEIAEYLSRHLKKLPIERRDSIIGRYLSPVAEPVTELAIDSLAKSFAQAKIRNPNSLDNSTGPFPGEISFERKWLLKQPEKPSGLLYDAVKLQRLYFGLLFQEERNLNYLHVIILNQLFGTWDEANRRYHARTSIYGLPCLISTAGLVEAPAKPREFYLKRQAGVSIHELKKEFQGRFIDYDDPRMTELVKGYVMQAIFYYITGEPFCNDKQCRLFNAHWQEELIQAQLDSDYEFCPLHQEILESTNSPV